MQKPLLPDSEIRCHQWNCQRERQEGRPTGPAVGPECPGLTALTPACFHSSGREEPSQPQNSVQDSELGLLLYLNGNCKEKNGTRPTRAHELSLPHEHHASLVECFAIVTSSVATAVVTWRGDSTGAEHGLRTLRRQRGGCVARNRPAPPLSDCCTASWGQKQPPAATDFKTPISVL